MSPSSVFVITGIAFLVAALLPGIETKQVVVPKIGMGKRIILGILSMLSVGTGVVYGAVVENRDPTNNAAPAAPGGPGGSTPIGSPPASAQGVAPHGPRPDCPGPSRALPPGNSVDITDPKDDDPVDYGLTDVKGTATLATGYHLWFFVWGPTSQEMYIMGGGRPDIESGLWTYRGLELGDGSGDDQGKYFCLTAIVVNAGENAFLENVVATRAATSWALKKDEIPQEGLARIVTVYLRQAR